MSSNLSESDAELVRRFKRNFAAVASLQGRLAYLVMSVHAIHPHFLNWYVTNSTSRLLYCNMLYGIGATIFSRRSMDSINLINRASFSILGSLMFNYGSMAIFTWIRDTYATYSPYLATCMSFLAGRLFMLHLLAFLYHVDKSVDPHHDENSSYESMYIKTV